MRPSYEDDLNCGNNRLDDRAQVLLDALRLSTLDVPNRLSFRVIHKFSMHGLTDPNEEVHILTDVHEPSGRYLYGLVITSERRATMCLLANGNSGHSRVFTQGGEVSDVGPRPRWSTSDEWVKIAIETAVHTLIRRNESRRPDFEYGRVRADEHLPLMEFKLRTGCPVRLRSWRLADTVAIPEVEGARVELWTGLLADGLITYSAIAAGYNADGTIAALACVEGMPSGHELAFLGVFTPDGSHRNLGPTVPGEDFVATAVPLLVPYLGDRPA